MFQNSASPQHVTAPDRSQLILHLKKQRSASSQAIAARTTSGPAPLSYAQEGIWIMSQMDSGNPIYNVSGALNLQGALNREALEQSLAEVIRRHEILRTRFFTDQGKAVQHARAEIPPLDTFDLSGWDLQSAEQHFRESAQTYTRRPFDLSDDSPLRALLAKLDASHHVLLLVLHHIVADRWSVEILLREAAELYTAYCNGLPSPLPELSIQYADYAVWQRSQPAKWESNLGYWTEKLRGAPPLLELPSDRPRPPRQSYRGESLTFAWPESLGDAVKDLAKRHNATLFMITAAAFNVLLYRYSGSRDICIGYTNSGRKQQQTAGLIGFFVNTLVLRSRLNDGQTFAEFLQQVRDQAIDDQTHQDFAFGQLLEALAPERNPGHTPVFQVMLTVQNAPQSEVSLPGLQITPFDLSGDIAQYDLTLLLEERNSIMHGMLEYSSDLFDASTATRMAGHLETLLQAVVDDPELPVSRLPLMPKDELRKIVYEWNDTIVYPHTQQPVYRLFEQQARLTPEKPAVLFAEQTLTYRELDTRAEQLAARLMQRNIGPESRVGVSAERSIELIVALLAVQKAGAAYIPLDPSYPAERRDYIVNDSDITTLLTQKALAMQFQHLALDIIAIDESSNTDTVAEPVLHHHCISLNNTAYVIYTSGSTGLPKGVLVNHANLLHSTLARQNYYRQAPECFLLLSSFAFDSSVAGIFWTLSSGGSLCLPQEHQSADPAALVALAQQHRVSHLLTLPPFYSALLKAGGKAKLGSLQAAIVAGEACPGDIAADHHRVLPGVAFYNEYGPTEGTVWSSVYQDEGENAQAVLSIGRAINNVELYIMDGYGQPAPIGVSGELCIGGKGVTQGYLNRPALTAEKFVPHPYSGFGERLYKSGDLARFKADGSIEFLGRIDQQVKIRGYRIEIGEIEAQLAACSGISEAAVAIRENDAGDKRLVAYVVAKDVGRELSADELRLSLKAFLPGYMIPAAFVFLSELPLTPNGKLDRNALLEPDNTPAAGLDYQAPQGRIETVLAQVWQNLLGIETVGRHDHFFELGGHSLLAIAMVEQLQEQGIEADVINVFTTPTLSELAEAIAIEDGEEAVAVSAPPNLIPAGCSEITPDMLTLAKIDQAEIDRIADIIPGGCVNIQDIYPLSPMQEGILFHHLASSESDAYVKRSIIAFDGKERLDAFLAALQTVIDRHDILRTSVFWNGLAQPLQVVHRQARLPIDELQLAGGKSALAQLDERTDPRRIRMNLQQAPLFAAYIAADCRSDELYLSLLNHHMVDDNYTLQLILSEIRQILKGQIEHLPQAYPYRDFIARIRQTSDQEHEAYFRERLAKIDTPTAPFGIYDVQSSGEDITDRRLTLSKALAQCIHACAKQYSITPAVLFHTAWARVLQQCTGNETVVFGTVMSGRVQGASGANKALGVFINTLPIDVTLAGHSVRQCVDQTYRRLSELIPHEQASLVLAQRCSGIKNGAPLFTTLFNYRHDNLVGEEGGDYYNWEGMRVTHVEERSNYPIIVSVDDGGEDFSLTVHCVSGIDPERVGGYFATAIESLVDALAEQPDRPVMSVNVLPEAEREQLLGAFNATEADYPSEALIQQLFEDQVERQPDAIALIFEGRQLSYAELNARANRVAHALLDWGVCPDDRVAICAERSLEMVIGLLAILKAGGAYVPLDPGYPAERLSHMLADCAPAVLLTQSALLDSMEVLQSCESPVLLLDEPERFMDYSDDNPDPEGLGLTSANLAYVIYTSGSTGQPKGAMNAHRAVVNRLLWAQAEYRLESTDRVLQKTPFSFDVSVWEFFLPLLAGAQLVVARPQGHQDPQYLTTLIEAAGVTTLHFVPSMLPAFLDAANPGQCSSLKRVLCSGESLPPALQQRFLQQLPEVELHNLYGPTEAAIDVTSWCCESKRDDGIVPIGQPIFNTRIYILDRHLQVTLRGVAGELYIGGDGVARGYLNRPGLTAERFIPDPFGNAAGARLYKTGDLARWLPDGNLEFLGRNDFQVKIRGFRIELGEIEAQLLCCPGVKDAVVIAREDGPGDKRLVAYVIAEENAEPAPSELRSQLAVTLADYMLPAAFVTLPAFPLTPNGKLDRKALPAPDGEAVISRAFEPPQGPVETAIAEIWQELLQVERVGRHDHFFELGGHSLLVVALIEKLRQQGWTLDIRSVFAAPTLAEMVAVVESRPADETGLDVPPNLIPSGCEAITPNMLPLITLDQQAIDRLCADVPGGAANIQDIYPLAPLQEGILFHHLLENEGDAYLLRMVSSFEDRERLDHFLVALQQVIARHDILRTAIFWNELPQSVQVVLRNAPLAVEELRLLPDKEVLPQVLEYTDPRKRRLPLNRAPLMQAFTVYDAGRDEWILTLLNHHIVCDHLSLEVVITEVNDILQGRQAYLPPSLPYRNFIAQTLAAPAADHEAYFKELLGTVDAPTAPFGIFDVKGDGDAVSEAALPIADHVSGIVREAARRRGMSAAVLFHVAWAQVLAQCSGRDDVVFGTVLLGRWQGSAGADRVLGMFINTLPLRVQLNGVSVDEAVADAYRQLGELLRHEQAPLALAQRCSGVAAPLPLFTTLLNYRHSKQPSASDGQGWDGMRILAGEERTNYPVTVSVDDFGDAFSLTAQCTAGIDPERVAGYFATAVESLVDALADQPGQDVMQLNVLPKAERQQLLSAFNATDVDYSSEALIHQLFEAKAEQQPDAIALTFEDSQLSYAELNARANRVAHALLEWGVCPDDRVAICAERSPEMVVGLLGILKAGGAYVPMDPSYPDERLSHMLADCAPAVLLTQQSWLDNSEVLQGCDSPVLMLDETERYRDYPDDNPKPLALGLTSACLAYVIYTSGSTGLPKGVTVEHRSFINFLYSMFQELEMTSRDVMLAITTLSFDIAGLELFLPLVSGAKIHLADRQSVIDQTLLQAMIARSGATFIQATPTSWQLLLNSGWKGSAKIKALCGGEPLSGVLAGQLKRSVKKLWNLYGPTETTVWSTSRAIDAENSSTQSGELIGQPISNTQVYILDGRLQPAPMGVSGELYIGGDGVTRGYLNRPSLTADRFIPDPFGNTAGARLYKTGDLARWLPDGNLEYLGRNDFQVKIRGFRIELGEIEAKLMCCPGVKDAAVTAREDGNGGKRLVAYLIAEENCEPSPGELRSRLAATLADYMLPSAFVTLPAFPLTPNGKLDRKALPAPDGEAVISRAYEPPQGPAEIAIATIWQELLRVDRVGRNDNFFELGGHSLLAVQLASRLRQQLDVELPLRTLFAKPVLHRLTAEMAGLKEKSAHASLATIRAEGERPPLFLIHPIRGEVGYAREIAPHINSDIPVYALAAKGLLENETPLSTVEEMAERYIREIRAIQPHGPYHLAGWSCGGTIAYEMANQLIGCDEDIAFVGLIDTSARYEQDERDESSILLSLASSIAGADALENLQAVAGDSDLDTLIDYCRKSNVLPADSDNLTVRRALAVYKSVYGAVRQYIHPVLSAPLVLFAATENESFGQNNSDWRKRAGDNLDIISISGDHDSIMESPNIQKLGKELSGAIIQSGEGKIEFPEHAYSPQIMIRNGNANTNPVFCIPGAGASITSFFDLSQVLDTDLPIFGLQPRGLDGVLIPHIDAPAAARAYIKTIREISPKGPYRLIGHSFGGWVAFEMALQLTAEGEQVASLIILDSEAPAMAEQKKKRLSRLEMLMELVKLYEMSLGGSINLTASDLAGVDDEQQLAFLLSRLVDAKIMPSGFNIDNLRGIVRVFETNLNAGYVPSGIYEGPAHLVRVNELSDISGEQFDEQQDSVARWRYYAPNLELNEGGGNHMTLLAHPHVNELAAWMKPLL